MLSKQPICEKQCQVRAKKMKEEESIKYGLCKKKEQKHVVQAQQLEDVDTRKQDDEVPKEAYPKEEMNIEEKLVSDEKNKFVDFVEDLYNTYIDEVDEEDTPNVNNK